MQLFAKNFPRLMQRANYDDKAMAKRLGTGVTYIRHLRRGKRVSTRRIDELCRILNCKVIDFFR